MNCSDYPSPSKPFKNLHTEITEKILEEKGNKKAIRQWMATEGFGESDDRNLTVWFYIDGHGWNLVPIEFLLYRYGKFLMS
jgi:hypothetical protein